MNRLPRWLPVLLALLFPAALRAQVADAPPPAGWNGERAIELIRRAQARRATAYADTALLSYQADARGRVYFYLDREDTGQRNLVKTDQLALELFWKAPDLVKQRIAGWRDQKSLPTNIRYHIDHLAVVLENFGDEIRIGDGDEVRGVLHPAAPNAENFYAYRLTDSLTLRLPGAAEPVRVYEVQVRPRDLSQPGFIGSVFVERQRGDLVRMDFTFTPSAYVDRRLDYINISLDNGLWQGRFWLPNEQRVEIRRELPELDIPAGSVIRGTMRVGNYRFNEPIPDALFLGPRVVVAPRSEREAFAFDEPIDAELREQGLATRAELADIRREARALAAGRALGGLGGVRLRLPAASDLVRYDRAEGAVVALGLSYATRRGLTTGVLGGWAFGAAHPLGELTVSGSQPPLRWGVSAYGNLPRDVGVGPAASGLVNTLSALFAGRDYLDPFYASGAELRGQRPVSAAWTLSASVRAERQRSAALESDFAFFEEPTDFRPVHRIDEGTLFGGSLGLRRFAPAEAGAGWTAELRAEGGVLAQRPEAQFAATDDRGDLSFVRPEARVAWNRRWPWRDATLELGGTGGAAWGELPRQALFLIGGRGTLPGYPYREFGGDRYALGEATYAADLATPWLRGRLRAGAGWADAGDPAAPALRLWGAQPTGTIRPTIGAGVGILHDIVHVDLFRGLGDRGRWELVVEAQRSFWDFL